MKQSKLIGRRYGRLVVLSSVGPGTGRFQVRCDCGTKKTVDGGNLASGDTRSCGCLNLELITKRRTTHGMYGHPYKGMYAAMLARCNSPTNPAYALYGGRGVAVCDRWSGRYGFPNFVEDMGRKPTPKHSLDRKDNEGNYSPENCRWATQKEQGNNTRVNRIIEVFGVAMTVSQAAEKYGLGYATLLRRLNVGASPDEAVTTPLRSTRYTIEYKGSRKTIGEWAKLHGMKYELVRMRLKRGWDIAEALETPVGHRYGPRPRHTK